eukprot:TRINITY_DN9648_c0_g1_i2.p1 TRINITY_DN9648_c0_g1~~TRINITY_DN9648_c0_g1_i2.p1  ORF type:complete len:597 (-),score=128.19 TRINITY_DN9648_c0_g1_i2:299-2089(-)
MLLCFGVLPLMLANSSARRHAKYGPFLMILFYGWMVARVMSPIHEPLLHATLVQTLLPQNTVWFVLSLALQEFCWTRLSSVLLSHTFLIALLQTDCKTVVLFPVLSVVMIAISCYRRQIWDARFGAGASDAAVQRTCRLVELVLQGGDELCVSSENMLREVLHLLGGHCLQLDSRKRLSYVTSESILDTVLSDMVLRMARKHDSTHKANDCGGGGSTTLEAGSKLGVGAGNGVVDPHDPAPLRLLDQHFGCLDEPWATHPPEDSQVLQFCVDGEADGGQLSWHRPPDNGNQEPLVFCEPKKMALDQRMPPRVGGVATSPSDIESCTPGSGMSPHPNPNPSGSGISPHPTSALPTDEVHLSESETQCSAAGSAGSSQLSHEFAQEFLRMSFDCMAQVDLRSGELVWTNSHFDKLAVMAGNGDAFAGLQCLYTQCLQQIPRHRCCTQQEIQIQQGSLSKYSVTQVTQNQVGTDMVLWLIAGRSQAGFHSGPEAGFESLQTYQVSRAPDFTTPNPDFIMCNTNHNNNHDIVNNNNNNNNNNTSDFIVASDFIMPSSNNNNSNNNNTPLPQKNEEYQKNHNNFPIPSPLSPFIFHYLFSM